MTSSKWESQPCWLTRNSGSKAPSTSGTTALNARSHWLSAVPAGSATLTAVPGATRPPVSHGQPEPGNSVRPLSCRLIVMTRGSS